MLSKTVLALSVILSLLVAGAAQAGDDRIKMKPGESKQVRGVTITVEDEAKKPLVTDRCIKTSESGDCREHEYTYSVQGASCTAECLEFDSFDKCRLRNRCDFDEGSGCFKKQVCVEVGTFAKCKEWREDVACN